MEHDGLRSTILTAILSSAPVEQIEKEKKAKMSAQKSLDVETVPEKERELRRSDSDPGPPTTASAKSVEESEKDDGEGREDLICIKADPPQVPKAETKEKDHPATEDVTTDRRKTLLRAVCRDDADTVEMILKDTPEIVDFSFPFTQGYTPLHFAAKGGHRKAAQVLLVAGANLDAKTTFQYTPHHLAAMADDLEMIDILDAFLPEGKPRHLNRDLSGKTYEDYLENSDRIHLHNSQLSLCRSSPSPLPAKDSCLLTPGHDSSFSRFDTVRRTVGKFFAREATPTKK